MSASAFGDVNAAVTPTSSAALANLLAMSQQFAIDTTTTTGLTFGLTAGKFAIAGGVIVNVNASTFVLGANTTSYICTNAAGVLAASSNIPVGSYALWQVVTGASSITSSVDLRLSTYPFPSTLAILTQGGVDYITSGVGTAATNANNSAAAAATSASGAAASGVAAAASAVAAAQSAADALVFANAAAAGNFLLSMSTGLTGGTYDGSTNVTIAIDPAVVTTLLGNQTLSNKTIALGSNNISGTLAQLNAAITDADIARTDAGQTLTGKQSINGSAEFAAVSATLPALTIVDHCFHFAENDTDKGAWRKRKGQSWRSEARSAGKYLGTYATASAAVSAGGVLTDVYYNTTNARFEEITNVGTPASTVTYRAGKEDYPAAAMITAEASRVIIWDIEGNQPSMWMVFSKVTPGTAVSTSGLIPGITNTNITSIAAANATLLVGTYDATTVSGVSAIDFMADGGTWYTLYVASAKKFNNTIAQRNINVSTSVASWAVIVSPLINDVAITILADAPKDIYGLPVPTIAAATDGGASIVKHDGSVVNSFATLFSFCIFTSNWLVFSRNSFGTVYKVPLSNITAGFGAPVAITTVSTPQTILPLRGSITNSVSNGNGDKIAYGHVAHGISPIIFNKDSPINSLIAGITSAYNAGWMCGDTRRCFLANSQTADRSVRLATLAVVGTPTETVNAGGRNTYSGFSAANYFQEASHADWNAIGTGDFSIIMSGVKWGTASTLKTLLSIGDGASNGSVKVEHLAANTLRLSIYNAGWTAVCTSTMAFTDTAEHVVEIKRYTQAGVASTCAILVDGIVVASAVSTLTISNATGFFRIGEDQAASQPWAGGQVACVRTSLTAPTAEQSKFIAASENALNGGVACLLSSSNIAYPVQYFKGTDLLEVSDGGSVDYFNGLRRVAAATIASGLTGSEGQLPKATLLRGGTSNKFWKDTRSIFDELRSYQVVIPKEQQYLFTTPAATTTQVLPKGWKARGVAFNTTDGTFLGTYTQTFDGFIWTVAGLTASKAYQINLVEDL